jgi:hypothetical protein
MNSAGLFVARPTRAMSLPAKMTVGVLSCSETSTKNAFAGSRERNALALLEHLVRLEAEHAEHAACLDACGWIVDAARLRRVRAREDASDDARWRDDELFRGAEHALLRVEHLHARPVALWTAGVARPGTSSSDTSCTWSSAWSPVLPGSLPMKSLSSRPTSPSPPPAR